MTAVGAASKAAGCSTHQKPSDLSNPYRSRHARRVTTIVSNALSSQEAQGPAVRPASTEMGFPGHPTTPTNGSAGQPNRRHFSVSLAGCTLMLLASAKEGECAEQPINAEPAASSSNGLALEPFSNTQQGYSMMVPVGWEKKGKAGADVLFEDPARRSTSIGVTVNPVRVPRIEEFGSLEVIGQRLLDTERKKESTMGVTMVSQQQRAGLHGSDNNGSNKSGATLYDYEYDLNSTRGRKRILNTVTIYNSKLFILNGNLKCDKVEGQEDGGSADAPCIAPPGSLDALRAAARSFDVLPAT